MLKKLFAGMGHYLSGYMARRHHRPIDVYIIGFPKTGNTWTHAMVGRYLQLVCGQDEIYVFNEYDRWGNLKQACIGPSLAFTHSPLIWDDQTADDISFETVVTPFISRKVLLLTRHPLDTMVSHWFHARFRSRRGRIPEDMGLVEFMEHPVFGLEKYIKFYNLWAEVSGQPNLMCSRYEDLRRDTALYFERILAFLTLDCDDALLDDTIAFTSFENMQNLERQDEETLGKLKHLINSRGKTNVDSYKVRRGEVGGYKDHLTPEEVEHYETRIAQELHEWYGYAQSTVAEQQM